MKTFYVNSSTNILVDTENNTCGRLNRSSSCINDLYLAKEPMHVVYGSGEYNRSFDVEEGDIIITFYTDDFTNRIIVVKNDEWKANLLEKEKKDEEEKLRWAAKKNDPCCDCENCCKASN